MAQQKAPAEVNKFVGGFISDASPLTFPENASLVDINMELNTDGSRKRALGIDLENGYQTINTGITGASSTPTAYNTYRWENVAGDPFNVILCVQFGNQVKFFRATDTNISSNLITTMNFSTSPRDKRFSFASVDGKLVVATGINAITIVTYSGTTLTRTTSTIKVRDFFGVEDISGGVDLTSGSGVQVAPSSLSNNHQYNLRNQGFAIPRVDGNLENLTDPISIYVRRYNLVRGVDRFPPNSETVISYLYADASDSTDRITRRYFANDAVKNPVGSSRAAQGHYIIDLLNRGASRRSEVNRSKATYPELIYSISSLKADRTPNGATAVGEFSGRVWYGGFSGEVIDGDSKSPQLSSYIAFSQLVTEPSVITRCYQSGDPTSDVDPDIIDTDGGYIRLNNAYGICSFVNLGKSLMIVAANGVWRIFGGNDSGFSATNYVVEKITDKGVDSPGSVVQVENTLIYWSQDGIYHLKQNEFGDWSSDNITQTKIQKFYNAISVDNKLSCVGVYDGYQRKVRWLYGNRMYNVEQQKELILDLNLGAFYERHIGQTTNLPIVMGSFNSTPYKVDEFTENVTVSGVDVTVGSEIVQVVYEVYSDAGNLFETGYVVVTLTSPSLRYTFASYRDAKWVDWRSYDGVGVDVPATLITGAATGGDNMRFKQIPYLYIHSRRTENGFELDENGDYIPINQSSCRIQSMWDWTNSVNSNKWGQPFQGYRYKRVYMPSGPSDTFDYGYETIVTKNKLRGRGRAIALKFTSEPGKEMHLYGWSFLMAMNTNV